MSASAPTSTSEAAQARSSLRRENAYRRREIVAEPKSLFENDFVLPSQGLRNSMAGGERELYAALLEGALLDMERPAGRLQSDARAWVMSGNRGKVTFSQCCDWLRLDEGKVRKRALDGEFRFERRGGPVPEATKRAGIERQRRGIAITRAAPSGERSSRGGRRRQSVRIKRTREDSARGSTTTVHMA